MGLDAQMTSDGITGTEQIQQPTITRVEEQQQGQAGQSGSVQARDVRAPTEKRLGNDPLNGYCEEGDCYDL